MNRCRLRSGFLFSDSIQKVIKSGYLRQHRTIPPCGKAPAPLRHGICVAKMLDNVGLRYHRASGQKAPRTLRPLPLLRFAVSATAALTFAASSIICAFGLASAAPRSPYRHLELCGIALNLFLPVLSLRNEPTRISCELPHSPAHRFCIFHQYSVKDCFCHQF